MDRDTERFNFSSVAPSCAGLLAGLAAAALVTLAACNTVEGAGRDIESAGDAIEDTARDAKD